MTLRQLELFIALAKNPNISLVAKDHFLTQSAVSVALKGLEEDLGVKLFDRLHRRLALSSSGRIFLKQLEPVMRNLNEVLRTFEGDNMTGTLVIGASSTIADYILPQILFEFNDRFPDVEIETVFTNPHDIVDGLEHGDIDLGLIESQVESDALNFDRLCRDELYIVSTDEAFANGGPYEIEDLLSKKWILREEGAGSRDTFDHYMGHYLDKMRISLEIHHTVSIKKVLQNPGTVSCLSPFAIQRELDLGELFRVHVEGLRFFRHFYAAVHKDKYQTKLLQKFLHAVESYLKTDSPLFPDMTN